MLQVLTANRRKCYRCKWDSLRWGWTCRCCCMKRQIYLRPKSRSSSPWRLPSKYRHQLAREGLALDHDFCIFQEVSAETKVQAPPTRAILITTDVACAAPTSIAPAGHQDRPGTLQLGAAWWRQRGVFVDSFFCLLLFAVPLRQVEEAAARTPKGTESWEAWMLLSFRWEDSMDPCTARGK